MSELTNNGHRTFQWQLLTTVSALALLGAAYGPDQAKADDNTDRPTVWIELGGQLTRLKDGEESFSPSLMDVRPAQFSSSPQFEKMPLSSIDESGAITIQPDNSTWAFSASVRYGRSVSHTHVRQQTNPKPLVTHFGSNARTSFQSGNEFDDTDTDGNEHHLVVDFQAGKDVGLGLFGSKGTSNLDLGVRFAQFGTNTNIALKSDPDWHWFYLFGEIPYGGTFHSNAATLVASRSFRGVGPSLSWNASAPVLGNSNESKIALDWGLNAAVLFGRQKANLHQQTSVAYHTAKYRGPNYTKNPIISHGSSDIRRSRIVVVPNLGGFAGVSFRYSNAKVSFGYRADFFFGAMDSGIETHKSENVGFYGPFATISIGLGG
jgi:hypothetical protein